MSIVHRPQNNATEIMEVDGGEIVDLRSRPTALEAITRAEIDVQIATAKRYPRSMQRFMDESKQMVALDADLAAQCTYVLKDKKKQDGTPVSGPSVRLAEILAVCWGNVRIVGRITDDDGKMVTAQAVGIDLERNVGYSVEVKRGVTTSPKAKYNPGTRFSDDMVRVTCMAAIAIATRNVTFKVIPMAFVTLIEDEAQRVATGDVKTLPERTERAVRYFVGKGISEHRIYDSLGITGPADMTLSLLQTLNGYKVAVSEGHASLDEIFAPMAPEPPAGAPDPARTKTEALASKLGAKPKPTTEPPQSLLPDEPGSGG